MLNESVSKKVLCTVEFIVLCARASRMVVFKQVVLLLLLFGRSNELSVDTSTDGILLHFSMNLSKVSGRFCGPIGHVLRCRQLRNKGTLLV